MKPEMYVTSYTKSFAECSYEEMGRDEGLIMGNVLEEDFEMDSYYIYCNFVNCDRFNGLV